MPEYVYALFDFAPENPDEITFKAGDRIEVVEKDDTYSDGWWQVSSSSIGLTLHFDAGSSSCLGFAFGGHNCSGERRSLGIERSAARFVSMLPSVIRTRRNTHNVVPPPSHLLICLCLRWRI